MLTFCMCEGSNVEELEESTMTLREKMNCNKKYKTLIFKSRNILIIKKAIN